MSVIQRKRTLVGLTQEELAKKLSVDRSTVAKWETEKSLPRAGVLIKLAKIFGCTVDELLVKEKAPSETEKEGV